ncbi:hypothetical protein AB1Y20_004912 [Prymnesium parvum]|uniref:Tim44-like domain-containing protein n=1 Tax=Prymnesium parvum TaxID=97485 RepID=A0AB34IYE8_PRYPA
MASAVRGVAARALAQRSLVLRQVGTRHNFVSAFKDKLKKEFEANKELQQTLKELKNDQTLSKAAEAARGAAERGRQFVGEGEAKAEAKGEAKAEAKRTPSEGAAGGQSADADAPPPLHQRLLADATKLFNRLADAAKEATKGASSAAPSGPADSETNAVVVRPPSFWEKTFNQDSAFFGGFRRIFGVAGEAAGGVGDRVFGVFGETEQAEALAELKVMMPDFNQETFLAYCRAELVPKVINAFLKGDVEVLRAACRDQAYATLNAMVMERKARQMVMDPRILHMSDIDMEGVRIIGGLPTTIIAFELHQLHCVRSALTHAVVEGSEDDIRAVHYLFALQPNEEAESAHKWQVTEIMVRGMQQVY